MRQPEEHDERIVGLHINEAVNARQPGEDHERIIELEVMRLRYTTV